LVSAWRDSSPQGWQSQTVLGQLQGVRAKAEFVKEISELMAEVSQMYQGRHAENCILSQLSVI
jgi:hypothetical protein